MPTATLILNSGNLLNTNDVVAIAISGADYATARFSIPATGTATATAQISVDGGVNYVPAPYAKKVSAISANPTVQAISARPTAATRRAGTTPARDGEKTCRGSPHRSLRSEGRSRRDQEGR